MSFDGPESGLEGVADVDRNLGIVAKLIESYDGLIERVTEVGRE